ncbi:MAG: hypothetical protein GWO02_08675 [Gammaproteobacteria bacterium]|nr:hypothetical protein [Gammaproteobacteria bacterium]
MTASSNLVAMLVSPVATAPVSDTEKVPEVEMPFHGRWCGPGHPTEEEKVSGTDLSPVDLLDAACMKHDLCYEKHGGRPACRCDEEFIWRIKYLQYHVRHISPDARAKSFLILSWFESSPCSSQASPDEATTPSKAPAPAPAPHPQEMRRPRPARCGDADAGRARLHQDHRPSRAAPRRARDHCAPAASNTLTRKRPGSRLERARMRSSRPIL